MGLPRLVKARWQGGSRRRWGCHLDTGLLYRAVGRRVLDAGGDPADPVAAAAAAKLLTAEDLTRGDLRDGAASKAASQVASIPAVRRCPGVPAAFW